MAGHHNYFNIDEIRTGNNLPQLKNSKPTTTLYPSANYPTGLTFVSFNSEKGACIKSHFNHVKFNEITKAFDSTIHLDTWGDSIMYGAACTWFDNFKHDRDFQHGKLTLEPDEMKKGVSFPTEFSSQPAVIVWLSGFDIEANYSWRFSVKASHITTIGFQIVGKVKNHTGLNINSLEATWIAYPASRPNIDSGCFDTTDVNVQRRDRSYLFKSVEFRKTFESVPKVFFAISKLEWSGMNDDKTNLVEAYIGDTTTKSTTLQFHSSDSNFISAAGQWIAVQDY